MNLSPRSNSPSKNRQRSLSREANNKLESSLRPRSSSLEVPTLNTFQSLELPRIVNTKLISSTTDAEESQWKWICDEDRDVLTAAFLRRSHWRKADPQSSKFQ
jgi:hypothetical protein